MAKLREITPYQVELIEDAVKLLKRARDNLRTGGANNAAAYVARAIKSAEGAHNHAQRILSTNQ